jgi:hypothetical protein
LAAFEISHQLTPREDVFGPRATEQYRRQNFLPASIPL